MFQIPNHIYKRTADVEDHLNTAFKQYRAFLATIPGVIENLSQAKVFLEGRQKQMCKDLKQFQQQTDSFGLFQTKETEVVLEQLSNE